MAVPGCGKGSEASGEKSGAETVPAAWGYSERHAVKRMEAAAIAPSDLKLMAILQSSTFHEKNGSRNMQIS